MTPEQARMLEQLAPWLYAVPLLGRYIAWSAWARRQRYLVRQAGEEPIGWLCGHYVRWESQN